MLRKFFSSVGVITLVIFSFYYTDLTVNIVRDNDPIMKEIRKAKKSYEEDYINAMVESNKIIPGVSGIEVDEKTSYESMKKYGEYNENLMVFSEVLPNISVTNIYDKYISNGNKTKNSVGLVFVIDSSNYIEEIINTLDSKGIKATFFINADLFDNKDEIIKLISSSKHEIEFLSYNYDTKEIRKYSNILKKYTSSEASFCYLEKENSTILNNCYEEKMHTIIPSIITNNYPYSSVKENLSNGSIIKLKNNEITLRELKYILNYIRQKGYNFKTLQDLIKE